MTAERIAVALAAIGTAYLAACVPLGVGTLAVLAAGVGSGVAAYAYGLAAGHALARRGRHHRPVEKEPDGSDPAGEVR
jgi:uncharacterized membrane protein